MYEVEAFLSIVVAYAYVARHSARPQRPGPSSSCLRSPRWSTCTTGRSFSASAWLRPPLLCARQRLKRFALVAAGVAVLYLPWVPTVLSQVRHTGAPWSTSPGFSDLVRRTGGGGQRRCGAGRAGARRRGRACSPLARPPVGRRARDRGSRSRPWSSVTILARLALVAVLARLDDTLLRRRARARAAPRRARARRGRRARSRRARGDPVSLGGLLAARRQGECAADHGRAGELHASGRARRLDPSRAGAGAALLPRRRLSVGDHAWGRCRTPGSSTGAMPSPVYGPRTCRLGSARPSRRCGPARSSWSSHPSFATTAPGTPPGRISSGRSRRPTPPRSSGIRVSACSARDDGRNRSPPQLLQAAAGVRLSPSRIDFAAAAPWRGRSHDA